MLVTLPLWDPQHTRAVPSCAINPDDVAFIGEGVNGIIRGGGPVETCEPNSRVSLKSGRVVMVALSFADALKALTPPSPAPASETPPWDPRGTTTTPISAPRGYQWWRHRTSGDGWMWSLVEDARVTPSAPASETPPWDPRGTTTTPISAPRGYQWWRHRTSGDGWMWSLVEVAPLTPPATALTPQQAIMAAMPGPASESPKPADESTDTCAYCRSAILHGQVALPWNCLCCYAGWATWQRGGEVGIRRLGRHPLST